MYSKFVVLVLAVASASAAVIPLGYTATPKIPVTTCVPVVTNLPVTIPSCAGVEVTTVRSCSKCEPLFPPCNCGCVESFVPCVDQIYGSCGCGCNCGCGCGSCAETLLLPCLEKVSCNPCGCNCNCGCSCVDVFPSCPRYEAIVPTCGCSPCSSTSCITLDPVTTCGCTLPLSLDVPCGNCGCGCGNCGCGSCGCGNCCGCSGIVTVCGVPTLPPVAPTPCCSKYLRQVCVQPPFL